MHYPRAEKLPNHFHVRVAILAFALLFWYGYPLAFALLGASLVELAVAVLVGIGNMPAKS